jgi:hypothetical protein
VIYTFNFSLLHLCRKKSFVTLHQVPRTFFCESGLRSGFLDTLPFCGLSWCSPDCSSYFNYFCSLRLEGQELISQVFPSSPTPTNKPRHAVKAFPRSFAFLHSAFCCHKKIYGFNTHECKCLYLQQTSGWWHHTPGMSKTRSDMTVMNRSVARSRQRRGWLRAWHLSLVHVCRFTGMHWIITTLQRWQFLVMSLFITLCFSVTEELSPSRWPLKFILPLSLSLILSLSFSRIF